MQILIRAFLCLLLLTSQSLAALTVVQHHVNYQAGVTSLPVTMSSTGTGNLLIALVNSSGTTTSVTDSNGNSFSSCAGAPYYGSGFAFYLPRSTSGATTITAHNSTTGGTEMEVWEVNGFLNPACDTSAFVSGGAQSGGVATGASVTTATAVEFIVAFDKSNGSATGTTGAFTFDDQDGNGNGFAHVVTSAIGASTPSFLDGGSSFSEVTVAFKDMPVNSLNYYGGSNYFSPDNAF